MVRDGLALVPDNVDGTVVVVDLDAGRVKRTLRLDLVASEAVVALCCSRVVMCGLTIRVGMRRG